MADDWSILLHSGFDLDTAVFCAELSSFAYLSATEIDDAVKSRGFENSRFFDAGDVQGYWCSAPNCALLAFRGTSNPGQWLRDVRFFPASHPWGHVHVGFRNGVAAVEEALQQFDAVARQATHVWIVGHSLGGALALLAAARLKITISKAPLVHTYGQPAVGLNDFAERCIIELPANLWRFVNQSDIVTRVPPAPLYRHVGSVKRILRPGVLEALPVVTEAPATPEHETAAQQVIAGGSALEAARAAMRAGVTKPLLTDLPPVQLTDLEFGRLQVALGAGAQLGLESFGVEGALPWFTDHAIGEYIRLLSDIRTLNQAGAQPATGQGT